MSNNAIVSIQIDNKAQRVRSLLPIPSWATRASLTPAGWLCPPSDVVQRNLGRRYVDLHCDRQRRRRRDGHRQRIGHGVQHASIAGCRHRPTRHRLQRRGADLLSHGDRRGRRCAELGLRLDQHIHWCITRLGGHDHAEQHDRRLRRKYRMCHHRDRRERRHRHSNRKPDLRKPRAGGVGRALPVEPNPRIHVDLHGLSNRRRRRHRRVELPLDSRRQRGRRDQRHR